MAPSAKMSLAGPTLCESTACSGDMYPGDPRTSPTPVVSIDRGSSIDAPLGRRRARALRLAELGQAPVEDDDLAELAEHHVGGLEIAVDDAALVRELDRQAHALEGREELPPGERRRRAAVAEAQGLEHLVQGAPAHAAHGEVLRPVGPHAEVVDGHDRGVLELPLHLGLEEEARPQPGALRARPAG